MLLIEHQIYIIKWRKTLIFNTSLSETSFRHLNYFKKHCQISNQGYKSCRYIKVIKCNTKNTLKVANIAKETNIKNANILLKTCKTQIHLCIRSGSDQIS